MKNIFKRRVTLKPDEMVTFRGMWEQKLTEGTRLIPPIMCPILGIYSLSRMAGETG